MTDAFFVDSNILVYRRDANETTKQPRAARWINDLWRLRSGRVSVQVLEEFYQVVTRRLKPGLSPDNARSEVREFFTWKPIAMSPALLESAWAVESRYRLSFWDSLIVAAARVARCRYLLSEDLQDGQDLLGVTVVDPFAHEPAAFGVTVR